MMKIWINDELWVMLESSTQDGDSHFNDLHSSMEIERRGDNKIVMNYG